MTTTTTALRGTRVAPRVASVGEGFVAIWDPATGEVVDEAVLDGTYAAVDFSPDDAQIALLDDREGAEHAATPRPSNPWGCP